MPTKDFVLDYAAVVDGHYVYTNVSYDDVTKTVTAASGTPFSIASHFSLAVRYVHEIRSV